MSKYTKHTVLYIGADKLDSLYKEKDTFDYKHLGIQFDTKFAICKIMYSCEKVIKRTSLLYVKEETYNKNYIKVIDTLIKDFVIKKIQLGIKFITIRKSLEFLSYFF